MYYFLLTVIMKDGDFKVYIKTMRGETLTVFCELEDTLFDLKSKLLNCDEMKDYTAEDMNWSNMVAKVTGVDNLIILPRDDPTKTLVELGIKDETVLHMMSNCGFKKY